MIVILTTVPSLKEGRRLAGLLVSQKLAACVSLTGAVESHFIWKGKREKAKEYFCWIKTQKSIGKKVEALLLKHHPYEVPEILFLPVTYASKSYLKWIKSSV